MESFVDYQATISVAGFTGLLLIIQLLVVDVVSIKAKHTPGFPIEPDHGDFLFRASRAFSNTNETVAVYLLFAFFGVLSLADPNYLNGFAMIYLVGRVGHMAFYYLNVALLRSICFVVSLIGLLGMFVVAWL